MAEELAHVGGVHGHDHATQVRDREPRDEAGDAVVRARGRAVARSHAERRSRRQLATPAPCRAGEHGPPISNSGAVGLCLHPGVEKPGRVRRFAVELPSPRAHRALAAFGNFYRIDVLLRRLQLLGSVNERRPSTAWGAISPPTRRTRAGASSTARGLLRGAGRRRTTVDDIQAEPMCAARRSTSTSPRAYEICSA